MNGSNSNLQSVTGRLSFLDGLRGYAIIMVVATHAMAYVSLDDSTVRLFSFWVQGIAVPPFFLADGYLFVHALKTPARYSYAQYCLRSARRLLIPWISFNLLYLCSRAIFELLGQSSSTVVIGHSVRNILEAIYYSEISAQLYFLPALFCIRLTSFAIRFFPRLPLSASVMIWLLYAAAWTLELFFDRHEGQLDPIVHAAWGMQYYILGMILGSPSIQATYRPHVLTAIAAICLGITLLAYPSSTVLAQYAYLTGAYFLFLRVGETAYPFIFLGRFTMGIYLLHSPILLKLSSVIVGALMGRTGIAPYLALAGATIMTSLLAIKACRCSRWGQVVLGEGRKETALSESSSVLANRLS